MNKLTSIAVLCTVLSGNAMAETATCSMLNNDLKIIRGWADRGASEVQVFNTILDPSKVPTVYLTPGYREVVLLAANRIYSDKAQPSTSSRDKFEQYVKDRVEDCNHLGIDEFVSRNSGYGIVYPVQLAGVVLRQQDRYMVQPVVATYPNGVTAVNGVAVVTPQPAQQPEQNATLGDVVGAIFGLVTAIVTPLAKGYVDQGNENARNRSGRSPDTYNCITTGGTATQYGNLPSSTSCTAF